MKLSFTIIYVQDLFMRSMVLWLGLFVLAFINGALREVVMVKMVGIKKPLAHQLSCLTGAVFWTTFVWLSWSYAGIGSLKEAVIVGIYWFVLTVLAETFLINRLMGKMTWKQILQTYNVARGELWGLVLIYVGLLPLIVFMVKG